MLHRLTAPLWKRVQLMVVLAGCALGPNARGNTTLFFENFNSLPLQTSVSYTPPVPNAFTHNLPSSGWSLDNSGIPPDSGRPEWRGWSFARKTFWNSPAIGGGRRQEFNLGQGTIVVADPAEWNELGNPADQLGFYNTILTTPPINLSTSDLGAKKLTFDSSWLGGCCDDGDHTNNQTAVVRLIFPGMTKEVLRWESAPFRDTLGRPSLNPNHAPNVFYKSAAPNERVLVDLTPFLVGVTFSQARLEFSLLNAGDDGWWAFDTMQLFSLSLVQGDMNIDGIVDANDIPAFALGVQNVEGYRSTYFGEFPVTRGSPDAVFDFDDIPWFTSLLEANGVGSAASLVQEALRAAAVPEPTSFMLLALALASFPHRRLRRRRTRLCLKTEVGWLGSRAASPQQRCELGARLRLDPSNPCKPCFETKPSRN